MDKQREDFEKWYKEHETLYHKALVRFDNEFDAYDNDYIQSKFFVWQQAQKQAIPEGYILVPKEPTEAMIDAGEWQLMDLNEDVTTIYKAMIGAQEQ